MVRGGSRPTSPDPAAAGPACAWEATPWRALAFALALARPPAPSALFSGNTLAVAVIGLALFTRLAARWNATPPISTWASRPSSWRYFGAYYFLQDLAPADRGAARQALGYAGPAARSLPGHQRPALQPVLAVLALRFSRRWKDDRLARHCHYIGVPFSVAACAYSGFEPRAALICLSGYTILYLLATWVFAAPRVQYLAIAAMAGAAYFGSTLLPAITLGHLALGAATIGSGLLGHLSAAPRFVREQNLTGLPGLTAGSVLSTLAILAATVAMILGRRHLVPGCRDVSSW